MNPIEPIGFQLPTPPTVARESEPISNTFSKMLGNAIGDVNKLLTEADKQSENLVLGKAENLHEAMIAYEKAETAFKLLTQVRNQALDAYNEIMRMQF